MENMAKTLHYQKQIRQFKRESREKRMKNIISWFWEIIAALVLAAVIAMGFCYSLPLQDDSMNPAIENGDRVLVNRIGYRLTGIQRGDVIVFHDHDNENAQNDIKRVIGLPGETIQISDGQIIINGETYLEKNSYPRIDNAGLADKAVTLGKDEYFVLGDNRNDSEDSRFADVGNISRDDIVGKAWLIISPLNHFGRIS